MSPDQQRQNYKMLILNQPDSAIFTMFKEILSKKSEQEL